MAAPGKITGYDVRIEVRNLGENTYAEGTIELDGEPTRFRAEADVSSRGTTYFLNGEPYWWSEIEWLDCWFEELWQDTASDHWNEELGEPEDFMERVTSEREEQE